MFITGGFVARNSAKLTVNLSQSDIITSRPFLDSLPRKVCHQSAIITLEPALKSIPIQTWARTPDPGITLGLSNILWVIFTTWAVSLTGRWLCI
jgi:hypothetical protein